MRRKALWKDIFMEIKTTWNRFLSIFLIVALGVAFFAGLRATNPDMRLTADQYFDDSRLMDIKVMGTWGLTEEEITAISRVNGVEAVEPMYSTHVVCDVQGNELVLEAMSATNYLNLISVTEGRLPEQAGEVLVDPFFLDSSGYQVGDTIRLMSGTEAELSATLSRDEFVITGVGTTAYYLSFQRGSTTIGSGDVDSFIVLLPEVFAQQVYSGAYVAVRGARELTAFTDKYETAVEQTADAIKAIADEYNALRYEKQLKMARGALTEAGERPAAEKSGQAEESFAAAERGLMELKKPEWYVLDRSSIEAYVEYEQNADRIGAIGQVFPAIFFLVAALISLTTMTRMVEEERTQIGTLKALGYSKMSIALKYILYALLATLGGSIAGAIVGLRLLPAVIITAYKILYRNLPGIVTPFNPYYAGLATLFSVFAVGLATFLACYKELKAKPADLMRPAAPKNGKRVLMERAGFLWNRLSFTWKATIRSLFRYKKRFLMTIFGIGGCMALLLVGFGLKDSIFVIYTRQFDEIMLYDSALNVDTKASVQERNELNEALSENPTIGAFAKSLAGPAVISGGGKEERLSLIVFENPEKISDFIVLRSRQTHQNYRLTDEGIILTEQIAGRIGVKAGDTVNVTVKESTAEVKVAAITENYMTHYIYMTPSLYTKLYGEGPEYNQYYLTAEDNKEKEAENRLLELPAASGIFYVSYLQELLGNVLASLDIVVWVLIIAAGALAFVVLYNLNNININERRRELATIKVLGFYDNEVSAYVYRENIILTMLGIIFGLVFGVILHRYVIETVEIEMVMFGRNIDLSSYISSILMTIFFSTFVNFVMFFKLRKINMVESLKSVE